MESIREKEGPVDKKIEKEVSSNWDRKGAKERKKGKEPKK